MRTVINGTGTILHTNLGRAPIGERHMRHIADIAMNYSNLEYTWKQEQEGNVTSHFEKITLQNYRSRGGDGGE